MRTTGFVTDSASPTAHAPVAECAATPSKVTYPKPGTLAQGMRAHWRPFQCRNNGCAESELGHAVPTAHASVADAAASPSSRALGALPTVISCRIRAPTVRKIAIHGYLSRHWRSGATTAITFSTGLARQCCRNISDICHLRGGGRKLGRLRIGLDHDGATLTRVPCSGLSLAFPPFGAAGVNEEGISCG